MQIVIVACALLGVALGQYTGYAGYAGYPGYAGYAGYAGYGAYPGYAGYSGYPGYGGWSGYRGYPGYTGYPGLLPVKPVDPKVKEVIKTVAPIIPAPVAPIVPAPLPALPIVPVAPAKSYAGPYAAIRSQTNAATSDGSYSWSYATENGIAAAESGAPRIGPQGPEEVVAGEYAYTSPEGVPVHVRYTADANGFHPEIISTAYNGYYDARSGVLPVVPVPVVAAEEKSVEDKKEE